MTDQEFLRRLRRYARKSGRQIECRVALGLQLVSEVAPLEQWTPSEEPSTVA